MTIEPAAAPVVAATTSGSETLFRLRADKADFVIVESAGLPQGVLTEQDLESAGDQAIGEVLEERAPLVVIELGELVEEKEVSGLVTILGRIGAPAAVVLDSDDIVGVIGAKALAEAMPLDEIDPGKLKAGLPGNPEVGTREYVCHHCVPPSYRSPRGGFDAPVCPRDPAHGRMEPDRR